jgi:hypothetical protein
MTEQASKFAPLPGYSRNAVNRAGIALREWWQDDDEFARPEAVEAFVAMIAFRESFQSPLNKTVNGLRSMVRSECPELKQPDARVPVAQRLKRLEQIVNKLVRIPRMQLWTMGDIGGCRAVLPSRDKVDGVLRRIRKNWDLHGRVRDYRDQPAGSGYRAIHVMVIRNGRLIEIQLRDPREHEWALAVERTGARLGIGLKEGEGPDDLKEYFRLVSLGIYMERTTSQPDPDFLATFDAARQQVLPYFRR